MNTRLQAESAPFDPIMPDSDFVPEVYVREWVLAQLGNDEDLLKDVIAVYLGDASRHEEELSRALASKDCASVRAAAHSIKSAVGNFGAKNAHEAAHALEEACKRNDVDSLPALTNNLLQTLNVLDEALKNDIAALR